MRDSAGSRVKFFKMEVRSIYKYARISPFKAREVAREIQGLPVAAALDIVAFSAKKASALIAKTLKSAIANAENNAELRVDSLVVKEAIIGEGPTFKRFQPKARGSAGPIRKRTSHIRIVLTDDVGAPKPEQGTAEKKEAEVEKRKAGKTQKKKKGTGKRQPAAKKSPKGKAPKKAKSAEKKK